MVLDDGILTICILNDDTPKGSIPKETLRPISRHCYGDLTVGYGRQYAAKGVSERVDKLVRIWQDKSIVIGMHALDSDSGDQFRIDNAQHLLDEDGLRITHLTLRRLDDLYDVDGQTEST